MKKLAYGRWSVPLATIGPVSAVVGRAAEGFEGDGKRCALGYDIMTGQPAVVNGTILNTLRDGGGTTH